MAQTTDAMVFTDVKLELSTDGVSYTDYSGETNSVALANGDRMTGAAYTFDGDEAILGVGKKQPINVTVRAIYTNLDASAARILRTSYENKSDLYVRWSTPDGGAGDRQYTTHGKVTTAPYPSGEAGSADPVTVEGTVYAAGITVTSIAS